MTIASVAFVIVFALYLVRPEHQAGVTVAEQDSFRQIIESANAQIVAESQGTMTEPVLSSPARPPNTLRRNPPEVESVPQPPDGYSFVEFHGDMSKASMARRDKSKRERPATGLAWLDSPTSIDELIAQAARSDRDWSFGWLRLAQDANITELSSALRGTGADIVGAAGSLIRVRLPSDEVKLQAISALPEVDGIGATPPEIKLQAVADETTEMVAHERIPVFVTLMASDSEEHWRHKLEDLGALVGNYDPTIRVYSISATYEVLKDIAMTDFVMAIEPVGVVEAAHDTAVPAMGADALRTYEGSPGLFSGVGGNTVPIAVMDTGLNINHLDISSNRSSICGANFVFFEPRVDDHDLWVDEGIHGTHVTGTIVGNGAAQPRYTGMAPLVQHIRFAKVLSHFGSGNDFFILRGMDFLAQSTSCPEAGPAVTPIKPLIVNMSLSATSRISEGRGVAERKLDSIVWNHQQLYVVAQSNASISGFSNYGTAKNSLAVGAALDSGSIAGFSSHGPTADGRLAPQIVGTGVDVYSAAGNGSTDGYIRFSGTSMASPLVAGVAALLMDAVPAFRERPALTRARLMASAIKPDIWLEHAELFPSNNSNGPGSLQMQYGLGKVSARTSVLSKEGTNGWESASAITELADGEYAYQDIEVPEGTGRLDLVLTWDEPPTDTLASAVLNDLDLWLDRDADCAMEPCGEYASASSVDNVEWIIISNPTPGMYRAKVAATRVYTESPRAALAWTTIRGESTPSLEIAVDQDIVEVEDRNEEQELTVTLTTNSYVAAGTRLFIDCRTVQGADCSQVEPLQVSMERADGIDPGIRMQIGDAIAIGELAVGDEWNAKIKLGNLVPEGVSTFRLYLKASAWNANSTSASVLVRTTNAEESELPESEKPTNDHFANAILISGDQGTVELDLIRTQTEIGEPSFTSNVGRPVGSVWYEWTASSNNMVSFSLVPDAAYDSVDALRVDVFTGDRVGGLTRIASADWGLQFFTVPNQTYRVRVSHTAKSVPLLLKWSVGTRPANDDFLTASIIGGVNGTIEGTN